MDQDGNVPYRQENHRPKSLEPLELMYRVPG
jgi:hypothetical protein